MKKQKDYLSVITICLLIVSSVAGIFSLKFSHSHEFVNQYGHVVEIYGYGIYANDSFFQAPISIGTDICILLILTPMFIFFYSNYIKTGNKLAELKLISVYAVAFYYAASNSLGLVYNRIFLVYVALFACSLFGMFRHIVKIKWQDTVEVTGGLKVFLAVSGIALLVAWMPDIIPTLFTGDTLSLIGVYTTCITYVLDMGIISPLCFVCIYLMTQRNPIGTLILAIMLQLCLVVGIMMITQGICQAASGIELPLPALITKSLSFLLLGGFSVYFSRKMYKELEGRVV